MSKVEPSSIIHEKALYLSQIGESFTLTKINSTFTLESNYFGNSQSTGNSKIPPIELGFIRRVKNHIQKNNISENFLNKFYYPNDIKYVNVKVLDPGTIVDDVVEIDINEAYWRTAFLLGVIDEKLYKEGSKENGKISKLGRLISLGSLAKKKDVYKYVGFRLIKHETTRSKLTENIWYSICKRVGDLMYEAQKISGSDFLLYWVDGIYVKNKPGTIKKIKALFDQYEYDVKTKGDLQVEYVNGRAIVTDKTNDKSRPFYLSKKKPKSSYFTDKELKETALEFSRYGVLDDLNDDEL